MKEKISIKKDESLNLNINEDEQFKVSTINTFKNNMVDGLQENKEITGEKQINMQEDLAEKISSDFAVVKKEDLVQPEGGSVPEEPKPIVIEKKVEALKSQDEKTYGSIVKAWEKYNKDVENGEVAPEDSIERLKRIVSASDSYTSWRFTFFMKASNPKYQRIMHAKEIYKTAKEQLDIQLKAKKSSDATKNDGIEYIHTDNATDKLTSFNKVGIFKKAFSVITGTFHWAAANIGSLLTSPFKKKKKESLRNRKKGYATLGDYWEAHTNFYNRVFGESHLVESEDGDLKKVYVSYSSRKTRENSAAMKEDKEQALGGGNETDDIPEYDDDVKAQLDKFLNVELEQEEKDEISHYDERKFDLAYTAKQAGKTLGNDADDEPYEPKAEEAQKQVDKFLKMKIFDLEKYQYDYPEELIAKYAMYHDEIREATHAMDNLDFYIKNDLGPITDATEIEYRMKVMFILAFKLTYEKTTDTILDPDQGFENTAELKKIMASNEGIFDGSDCRKMYETFRKKAVTQTKATGRYR